MFVFLSCYTFLYTFIYEHRRFCTKKKAQKTFYCLFVSLFGFLFLLFRHELDASVFFLSFLLLFVLDNNNNNDADNDEDVLVTQTTPGQGQATH